MESVHIKRNRAGGINIKSGNKVDRVLRGTVLILGVLTVVAFFLFDYTGFEFGRAVTETADNLKTMFLQPWLNHFSFGDAVYQVGITLALSVLATIIGAFFASSLHYGLLTICRLAGCPKQLSFLLLLSERFPRSSGC